MPDHIKLTVTDHEIKWDADLVTSAFQRDMVWHFGSSYYYNDKFIIYPSHVIEKLWNKYLGSTVQCFITKEKHFQKELSYMYHSFFYVFEFYKPWARSWVKNHSKCIRKIRLCLGFGFVGFILKQIK